MRRRAWCGQGVDWAAALLVTLPLAGCGDSVGSSGQGPLPPGYVAPASTESLPRVEHPEYANWSRFGVGTSVVRKKEVTNEHGTVRVTTTLRLTEKTADQVVVETQVTVDEAGHPLTENPSQPVRFPAQFALPADMKVEQFLLPSLKAKAAGVETLSIAGRDYKAELFTWVERNETGPMSVKYWRSDHIPGRMLRQEITGPMHNSLEEVVEINLPGEQAS